MQGEKRLDVLNRARHRRNDIGQTTGRDDGALAEFRAEPIDHAVDLVGEAVDGAGLDGLDGRLADHASGFDQGNCAERRSAAGEGIHADLDSRRRGC